MVIIKRAISDTFSKRLGQLVSASIAGLVSWLYLYFWHGEDFAVSELPFVIGAMVGTGTFISVLFIWNLACAPYRIEKDLRAKSDAEVKRLSEKVRESGRQYYKFSEIQLARLTENFRKLKISEDQIYVIFAPSSIEALDTATDIADSIQTAGIKSEAHGGGMFPHNVKDRGITVYHGSDDGPSSDAIEIVAALDPLGLRIKRGTLNQSHAGAVIYVARPPTT